MTTKEDLQLENIPKFIFDLDNYQLKEYQGEIILGWGWHHTVKQQKLKRNPELYKHLKMIYMPPINNVYKTLDNKVGNPHLEAENYHSRYKQRWGIELEEIIYKECNNG